MKLIFCSECYDVVRLYQKRKRYCKCGKSWGQYHDEVSATYGGLAMPVCFLNNDFGSAIKYYRKTGKRQDFIAFFCPMDSDTFRRDK